MVVGLLLKRVTIGSLPDEVLLEIFQFYRAAVIDEFEFPGDWHMAWPTLVHVCRRWRGIIFSSPLGLDLQIQCSPKTPVRKMLDVWPALPLAIELVSYEWERHEPDWEERWDNVVAAMECRDRVREITFSDLSSSLWAQVSTMLQEAFPALTRVWLRCDLGHVLALPDTFLAPRLQHLSLERIFLPSLRRFLLSTRDLTYLHLFEIPNDGYISPEAMVTSLSTLTKLESFAIVFISPTPQPKRRTRLPPPSTRTVLSALTNIVFQGVSEYLEVLAAQIYAPMLEGLVTHFFNQLVFDIPQISWLIGNLRNPRPSGLSLSFSQSGPTQRDEVGACFFWSRTGSLGGPGPSPGLYVSVLGKWLDWQVFSITQICNQILPLCSSVEWLNVEYGDWWTREKPPPSMQPDDMDHTRWLELFHSFISVKRLEISNELESFIAAALQGLTKESATGVFPTLNSLSIVGDTSDRAAQQGIEEFVNARQYSVYPVAFHRLDHWTHRS
jgi:F-box-like